MKSVTILLVDEDLVFAESMGQRLAKRELSVINAFSVSEALTLLGENDRIEVVIVDDKLPGLNGLSPLRLIRTLFPLIEVIMFTGHATIESAIEGLDAGAFEYLMKLCDLDYLVERVMEAALQKRLQEEKIFQAKLTEFVLCPAPFNSVVEFSC